MVENIFGLAENIFGLAENIFGRKEPILAAGRRPLARAVFGPLVRTHYSPPAPCAVSDGPRRRPAGWEMSCIIRIPGSDPHPFLYSTPT